jgi:hypothetical protein
MAGMLGRGGLDRRKHGVGVHVYRRRVWPSHDTAVSATQVLR